MFDKPNDAPTKANHKCIRRNNKGVQRFFQQRSQVETRIQTNYSQRLRFPLKYPSWAKLTGSFQTLQSLTTSQVLQPQTLQSLTASQVLQPPSPISHSLTSSPTSNPHTTSYNLSSSYSCSSPSYPLQLTFFHQSPLGPPDDLSLFDDLNLFVDFHFG